MDKDLKNNSDLHENGLTKFFGPKYKPYIIWGFFIAMIAPAILIYNSFIKNKDVPIIEKPPNLIAKLNIFKYY